MRRLGRVTVQVRLELELTLYATNGACSGFFSKTFPPKPKKGSNLFFEVQIVGLTKAYLRIATGVFEMPLQP